MSVGRVSRRLDVVERRLWVRGVLWANDPGCLEGLPLAFRLACSLSLEGWRVRYSVPRRGDVPLLKIRHSKTKRLKSNE